MCQPTANDVVGMLMLFKSIVVAGVMVMVVPLPGPGSVLKKYSRAVRFCAVTVKLLPLLAVKPPTTTLINPDVAPTGTVTVKLVAVLADTVACVPLKRTVLLAGIVEKFVPVITTVLPTNPDDGLKEEMVGGTMVLSTKKVL